MPFTGPLLAAVTSIQATAQADAVALPWGKPARAQAPAALASSSDERLCRIHRGRTSGLTGQA